MFSLFKKTKKKCSPETVTRADFVSFASHQLRAPLTSMKWGLEALSQKLQGTDIDSETTELIAHLRNTTTDLVSTVNDILDITKIDQGAFVLDRRPFDIVECVGRVVEEFRIQAELKKLRLDFVPEHAVIETYGDMSKIRQVVSNMLDNAIKYTTAGSIVVSLIKTTERTLALRIKDSGAGLAPEEARDLFNKFARGRAGKASGSGSGLGLHLAKKIVDLHGGEVWVESDGVNQGSTFIMKLPL